jgi:hypothetical protein
METKSAIAVMEGSLIKAVLCESGDYVDLAIRLQDHWTDQDRVKHLISQGTMESISTESFVCSKTPAPTLTFFTFADFMGYFEKYFCEDYYIMNAGIWYYTGPGLRSVTPLSVKLIPLRRSASEFVESACQLHGH